jgi:hypothetical protein
MGLARALSIQPSYRHTHCVSQVRSTPEYAHPLQGPAPASVHMLFTYLACVSFTHVLYCFPRCFFRAWTAAQVSPTCCTASLDVFSSMDCSTVVLVVQRDHEDVQGHLRHASLRKVPEGQARVTPFPGCHRKMKAVVVVVRSDVSSSVFLCFPVVAVVRSDVSSSVLCTAVCAPCHWSSALALGRAK